MDVEIDLDDAEAELRAAHEEVVWQRNNDDGHVSLSAVDRLTDAVDAFLQAIEQAGDALDPP